MVGTLELRCGPSGVGKSSSVGYSTDKVYTYTTRAPRNSADAKTRNFVDNGEFNRLVTSGKILAFYEYDGHRYGFSSELRDDLLAGKNISEQLGCFDGIEPVANVFGEYGTVKKKLFLGFFCDTFSRMADRLELIQEVSSRIANGEDIGSEYMAKKFSLVDEIISRGVNFKEQILTYCDNIDKFDDISFRFSGYTHYDLSPKIAGHIDNFADAVSRFNELVAKSKKSGANLPPLVSMRDNVKSLEEHCTNLEEEANGMIGYKTQEDKKFLPLIYWESYFGRVFYRTQELLADCAKLDPTAIKPQEGIMPINEEVRAEIFKFTLYNTPDMKYISDSILDLNSIFDIPLLVGNKINPNILPRVKVTSNENGWGFISASQDAILPFLPHLVFNVYAEAGEVPKGHDYFKRNVAIAKGQLTRKRESLVNGRDFNLIPDLQEGIYSKKLMDILNRIKNIDEFELFSRHLMTAISKRESSPFITDS